MTHPIEPGSRVVGTYGRLTIEYHVIGETTTVTVYQGSTLRIRELCQAFTTPAAAWAEAQRIATAAFAGKPVEQIIAERPSELLMAALREVIDAPATLPDTVPAGIFRQTRPTLSGAHLADLSDAGRRAIRYAAKNNGVVPVDAGFPRPVLRKLNRTGYGFLQYVPGMGARKVIESLLLNGRGWDEAEQMARVSA